MDHKETRENNRESVGDNNDNHSSLTHDLHQELVRPQANGACRGTLSVKPTLAIFKWADCSLTTGRHLAVHVRSGSFGCLKKVWLSHETKMHAATVAS
ncbi:hypothetical protein FOCG_14801 [Fusarium oxysporum f. sp. radicis-lycopersici 26381]|nr:hypothetical protein FOCG_14801 [Fusarium oxysporum f. sp. radicis-lycopersici 26381]